MASQDYSTISKCACRDAWCLYYKEMSVEVSGQGLAHVTWLTLQHVNICEIFVDT